MNVILTVFQIRHRVPEYTVMYSRVKASDICWEPNRKLFRFKGSLIPVGYWQQHPSSRKKPFSILFWVSEFTKTKLQLSRQALCSQYSVHLLTAVPSPSGVRILAYHVRILLGSSFVSHLPLVLCFLHSCVSSGSRLIFNSTAVDRVIGTFIPHIGISENLDTFHRNPNLKIFSPSTNRTFILILETDNTLAQDWLRKLVRGKPKTLIPLRHLLENDKSFFTCKIFMYHVRKGR